MWQYRFSIIRRYSRYYTRRIFTSMFHHKISIICTCVRIRRICRCGYVKFHHTTQFDITCLSRGQGGFMSPLYRGEISILGRTHSSSLRCVVKTKRSWAYLYRAPAATTKVYRAPELSPEKRRSWLRTGVFDEIESKRILLAYSTNCTPSDTTKRNGTQNERDRFLVRVVR